MIQFINNIIEWVNTNIHGIASITTILFVLFVFLNDKYDLTNEKCECGFKNKQIESPAYKEWLKKENEETESNILQYQIHEGSIRIQRRIRKIKIEITIKNKPRFLR
jgi:hypothetical protein